MRPILLRLTLVSFGLLNCGQARPESVNGYEPSAPPVPSVLSLPFQRVGDPILLAAAPAPQQYAVPQPVNTRSYRGVNPCVVDIRIKTVASMSDTVTAATGTRFLARTSETLASSPSLTGQTRIVSIMTMGDPGPNGCTFELGYGNGG